MCVELPCGYSSQTLTKIIAYCKITIYVCLIAATAIFGLVLESRNAELLWRQNEEIARTSLAPAVTSTNTSGSESVTDSDRLFSKEELTFTTDATTTEEVIPEADNDAPLEPNIEHDLIHLLEMSHLVRACFILWIIVNLVSGLIFSIVLLQGAQERNLFKVKIWFFVTIISYLLWIPIYAYWVCHAVEPVNALVSGFMAYMLGGLCLWIVSGFIEELRIESISHRVGYKDMLVPFYKV